LADAVRNITFVVPNRLLKADSGMAADRAASTTSRGAVPVAPTPSPGLGATRGEDDMASVVARDGEDVVELTVINGPTLVLSPQSAADLLRAQAPAGTRGAVETTDAGALVVKAQLGWPGLEAAASRGTTRGWMGEVALSAFKVLTGFQADAATLVASLVTKKIDGAVVEGVYKLPPDWQPEAFMKGTIRAAAVEPAEDGGPLLVLVHGTFVDTVSTFGKLWLQPDKVRTLFDHYRNRVYALDHPTVGKSPIGNALALVRALPAGARLHLLTHSRGGLVAEVLARACGGAVLGDDELALFAADAYGDERQDLKALVAEAQVKGLRVERMVRVACPARGTTLASGRLDAYLSVLQWGLKLAGVPVAPELVDFLHEVARRRADPTQLPGIEAMMPESALVKWLDMGNVQIPGDLRVVAGDMQGDSIGSWVKTLMADAFYWADNDLVVQTGSMYGGVPRAAGPAAAAGGASFLLDRGAKVNHFNYFANPTTVDGIVGALLENAPPAFAAIGPLSWRGESAEGTRGGVPADDPTRPAVFVLPGILGSNLKVGDKRVWLGLAFLNGLLQLRWDPATADKVLPDGPVKGSYEGLIDRLAETHAVFPFAFDWRRPIEDEAKRLAAAVDAQLDARAASGQPVRIVAHSMGGLVARTMQIVSPKTWNRLMAHADARLLMLGVPNAGSWAPMQILSGDDNFGNALVAFGSLFHNGEARKMMAGMPGLLQMQAGLLDPAWGLGAAEKWAALVKADKDALAARSSWHQLDAQKAVYDWSAPPQQVLDAATSLRRKLDDQVAALGDTKSKIVLVVGRAPFTPTGYALDGGAGLEYTGAADAGDGRVTYESAMQLGVPTWKLDAEHGKLPAVSQAWAAYVELLTTGKTTQLDAFAAPSRGAAPLAAVVRSRPSRGLSGSQPPSSDADVFGVSAAAGQRPPPTTALEVQVLNADIRFVQPALLVGHYSAMRLTGAEAVIDRLVGKGMSRGLDAGLYPDAVGSHQIFGNWRGDPENPKRMASPAAAIVCGLGPEGKLLAKDLVFTVRQAVLAYAQRLSEHPQGAPADFELAATLIGSGGTGITTGGAAIAVALGAVEARQRLQKSGWPQLSRLIVVELFLDRAGDAWRALHVQQTATPDRLKVVGHVESGAGAMTRMVDSGYRGASYDLISALQAPLAGDATNPAIAYTLDTQRARTEVRAQRAQGNLLRDMVAKASNDGNRDPSIGRTLFNLLVPVEMEPFLGGKSEMVIELESKTAGIPWELLNSNPDPSSDDQRPWAIRTKLLRKLRLEDFRAKPRDATPEAAILVVGEPQCDPDTYPSLEGARREATAVANLLRSAGAAGAASAVVALDQPNAQTVVNALFDRPYRAVHVAGHGAFGPNGGVVLSGTDTYLGANEIEAMRVVPQLVFLNCCHLAGREASSVLAPAAGPKPYDRAEFAANIAEALIKVGVRCVIAAGWAVDDEAAETFATTFYGKLLDNARFIEAVGAAREAAWKTDRNGNTWAAYQCYGDPDWTWRGDNAGAQAPRRAPADEYAGVASRVSLELALEKIAVDGEYRSPDTVGLGDKLLYLEQVFGPMWGNLGIVAEAFGRANANLGRRAQAVDWYRKAVQAEDGTASLKAAEQLGNMLTRLGEAGGDIPLIEEGLMLLEKVLAVGRTYERESLLGSGWKRMTLALSAIQGREADAKAALAKASRHYRGADDTARKSGDVKRFYAAKNHLDAEVRAALLGEKPPELADARIQDVRDALQLAIAKAPDFWSVVGETELDILVSLVRGRLDQDAPRLIATLCELKVRVPSPRMWDSVWNQARFVLEPCLSRKDQPEAVRQRVTELLATLERLKTASA
jgi:CHAT domain-containing protein